MAFTPSIRGDLASLKPYVPGPSTLDIVLSANENSYGLADKVASLVANRLSQVKTNRYPDVACNSLRERLAAIYGLSPENFVIGNGGDEFLLNVYIGFGGPDRYVIDTPPTFSEYRLNAELTATPYYTVGRKEDFSLDVEGIIAKARELEERGAREGIVILTTPNNPTGNVSTLDEIRAIADNTHALVLVDEAYQEFSSSASALELLDECPNIVVLRTLSKAFALAGARVGYLVAQPQVIDVFLAVRQPYSVNVFSHAAAEVILDNRDELLEVVKTIKLERASLIEGLFALARRYPGIEVYPTEANFVFVKVPKAAQVAGLLETEHSIGVRNYASYPSIEECLRITVGTPQENEAVVAALGQILENISAEQQIWRTDENR